MSFKNIFAAYEGLIYNYISKYEKPKFTGSKLFLSLAVLFRIECIRIHTAKQSKQSKTNKQTKHSKTKQTKQNKTKAQENTKTKEEETN